MYEPILHTKYDVLCPSLCYIGKCVMSQLMLHTLFYSSKMLLHTTTLYIRIYVTNKNIMSLSKLMLHKKMCNVRTYVTHEYEMYYVRTYVTYENVICSNVCYTRKYDDLCPNLRYVRKLLMFEHMLDMNMRCVLSELMLHTEILYVRTLFTHDNLMFYVEIYLHAKMCIV